MKTGNFWHLLPRDFFFFWPPPSSFCHLLPRERCKESGIEVKRGEGHTQEHTLGKRGRRKHKIWILKNVPIFFKVSQKKAELRLTGRRTHNTESRKLEFKLLAKIFTPPSLTVQMAANVFAAVKRKALKIVFSAFSSVLLWKWVPSVLQALQYLWDPLIHTRLKTANLDSEECPKKVSQKSPKSVPRERRIEVK